MHDRRKQDNDWDTWAMVRVGFRNGAWTYVVLAGLLILLGMM